MKNELVDIKDGKARTWKNFYDLFWIIATVRYVTYDQLRDAFPNKVWRKKCATPKILKALSEKGFLNFFEQQVLTITSKSLNFLKTYSNYNTDVIALPQGGGGRDVLYNTDALLKAIQLPDFHALFYPCFYKQPTDDQPFLIPDAALVLKRKNKAKLIFLEIERAKPYWDDYLLNKKKKYEIISTDYKIWSDWWRHFSNLLGLKLCPISQFGFLICCVGEFKADWKGWVFSEKI